MATFADLPHDLAPDSKLAEMETRLGAESKTEPDPPDVPVTVIKANENITLLPEGTEKEYQPKPLK